MDMFNIRMSIGDGGQPRRCVSQYGELGLFVFVKPHVGGCVRSHESGVVSLFMIQVKGC